MDYMVKALLYTLVDCIHNSSLQLHVTDAQAWSGSSGELLSSRGMSRSHILGWHEVCESTQFDLK
ncbi:Hypothetical predicted protein, partial [Xyrichtys novacula]